ncbi:hypothetical protein ACSFA8_24875 [Variovorax sp. RT4R15]|uniref:hypothetical protein n=1 Tax=Variovorax sp. RT4R15 TaxID=3443737 RepID=UPI003F48F6A8
MESDFHLHKVHTLSPKAAKIALRMLDADPSIPVESILALRPALVERCSESESFGTTDWMTIAAIDRPVIRRFTERFESREQRHARLWVTSLRREVRKAPRPSLADTAYDSL